MKTEVSIIDYGINNIQSVNQAFKYIGAKTKIVTKPDELRNTKFIVIPGVGAFPEGIKKLKDLGLDKEIKKKAKEKVNILGICLGMQMLFSKGYEHEEHEGLNLISGEVTQIERLSNDQRIPVIGWRETRVSTIHSKNKISKYLNNQSFYYLHSYQVVPNNKKDILATYDNHNVNINSAVFNENIWGVQFHPEKSGTIGLEFLKAFCDLNYE